MEEISIKTGQYEVINSGQVIVLSNERTEFKVRDLRLVFEFKDDENEKRKVETKNDESANLISVVFYNFDESLGMGNVKPIEIGVFNDGRKCLFSYRIYSLDDKTMRSIEYTFYLAPNA